MNIFEALRESHDRQRSLLRRMLRTRGNSPARMELFSELKRELLEHELSEERFFYSRLMQDDKTMARTRHSVAEHHKIDDKVEDLQKAKPSSAGWLVRARTLSETVHHHLKEEERNIFQLAGKTLSVREKLTLARKYLADRKRRAKMPMPTLS
jgi:hemerythrin superfamily protein